MTRKIITALLSLVVAIALWSYVIAVVGPEYQDTFRDIDVEYIGKTEFEKNNLMLLTEELPTVTLELSGNRSELSKLSSNNITVTVDLSKIEFAGKNSVRYNVDFPMNVNEELITIKNGTPAGITLDIAKREVKNVPIEVYFEGALPDDYIKEKPELEMDSIRISGPEDVVRKIESARIGVKLDENCTSTIIGEYSYTLCDVNKEPVNARYITVSGESAETVSLRLPIKRVKEIPLTVKVTEGGGATENNTVIDISHKTILVSGDETILENMNELEIGAIDLSTMTEDQKLSFEILLPEGVTNETGITQADVTVSFQNLYTEHFYATTFRLENVPAGVEATVSNVQLDVTIRGTESLVKGLDPEKIIVVVDCKEATVGSNRLDAVITIEDGTPEIGAVGTYIVLVQAEQKGRSAEAET